MPFLAAALVLPAALTAQARLPVVRPRPGLVITHSTRFAPGRYRLRAAESLDSALITVRGTNIVLDFTGVTLEGIAPDSDPDQARGVAVLVDGGAHVTIRGARIRGYKVGIMARGTRGFVLENSDLSYNWKPRLYSLVEHESLADWLSFHHNEHSEWLRFGSAIYLEDVHGGAVRSTKSVQGMNALMLVRSDSLRIERNTFSFNSGLGIGLYRSSDNVIAHNLVDFDVRGHSRFYHRGQDSADILMFEQSSRNVVVWNSVTHGGDGLFLWAGQTTMDSGQGGCNDNFFYGNDFSYAPANGIEATFSRNTFVFNQVRGNDYGVWGGYSYDSRILDNWFEGNRTGVAIEHGQGNLIRGNRFMGDTTAIWLWANPIEPSDWGYPKFRDTRSRDDSIDFNGFSGNRVALRLRQSSNVSFRQNLLTNVDSATVLRDTAGLVASGNRTGNGSEDQMITISSELSAKAARVGGPQLRPASKVAALPRSAIVVDEWGPYDWGTPKLWPVDSTHVVPLQLAVLGPAGSWRVVQRRGLASVSRTSGRFGDTISVAPSDSSDWELVLEARAMVPMTSPRGRTVAAGTPYRFSYGRFEPRMSWAVRFFAWSDSSNLALRPAAFDSLLQGSPVATRTEPRLDYMWYRPTIPNLPQARFATVATTSVTLGAGTYTLRSISDDAVRVWVDGALVIDDWTPHESAVDNAPISAGTHAIRVVHYQVDGWTELRVDIVHGTQTSRGSPGPH